MAKKIYWIILGIVVIAVVIVVILMVRGLQLKMPPTAKPQEIKIGFLGSLTGGAAKYGIEARNGAQLAISQLNAKQTRYQYKLVSLDNQGDPALAKKRAQELVANKEILVVVGDIISSCTFASGEIFQKAGLPAVSPAATSPKISELGDFIFRVCPSDTYQGKSLAEFVVQDLGLQRIAVFWDLENATYSGELADSFIKRAEELGAVITERLSYRAGQKEFASSLEKIRATDPQVLFIPGYYTEAALIAQQARLMGWEVPIIGGDGFHASELIEMGGKAVEGIKFTSYFIDTNPDPKVQDFVTAYETRFGTKPGWIAAHGYDAMNVIARAIEMEGPSREGIQKGLSEIKGFEGITGLISFDELGDVMKDTLKLEIREGKFRVWSP